MIGDDKIEVYYYFTIHTLTTRNLHHREINKYYKRRGNHHNTIRVHSKIINRQFMLPSRCQYSLESQRGRLLEEHLLDQSLSFSSYPLLALLITSSFL